MLVFGSSQRCTSFAYQEKKKKNAAGHRQQLDKMNRKSAQSFVFFSLPPGQKRVDRCRQDSHPPPSQTGQHTQSNNRATPLKPHRLLFIKNIFYFFIFYFFCVLLYHPPSPFAKGQPMALASSVITIFGRWKWMIVSFLFLLATRSKGGALTSSSHGKTKWGRWEGDLRRLTVKGAGRIKFHSRPQADRV